MNSLAFASSIKTRRTPGIWDFLMHICLGWELGVCLRRRAFALAFGLIAGFLVVTAVCIGLACAVLLRVRYVWLLAEVVVGWLCVVVR